MRIGFDLCYTLNPGERLRPWYRVAYVDPMLARGVAAIVGIHWVIMAGRRLWELSFFYRPSLFEAALLKIGDRSYNDGYRRGQAERAQCVILTTKDIQSLLSLMPVQDAKTGVSIYLTDDAASFVRELQ